MANTSERPSKGMPAAAPDAGAGTRRLRASPTHEQIAERAYARFVARGGGHGHDLDDWLAAECALLDEPGDQR